MRKSFVGFVFRLLINVFWFCLGLLLLDNTTPLEIKDQALRSFAYWGSLILSLVLSYCLLKDIKMKLKRIGLLCLTSIVLISFMAIGFRRMTVMTSSWKTQEISYQNSYCPANKVELQMKDIGALGYKKRRVEVMYWSSCFMICKEVEGDIDQKDGWVKVDWTVNELDLVFP